MAPRNRDATRATIPLRRDRAQSFAISAVLGTLVLYAAIFGVIAGGDEPGGGLVAIVSVVFALLVASLRASSAWGAFWGGVCCFTLTWWTRSVASPLLGSLLPTLTAVVLLTLFATRLGRSRKAALGLAERRGGRAASQVLANLGVAAILVSPLGAYAAAAVGRPLPIATALLTLAGVAALAEAAADTVSSEIGQAMAGRSRTLLITTFQRVPRGTDGGVSLVGTLSGLGAALLVVGVAWSTVPLRPGEALIAWFAGAAGLVFDSVLGATLERRGWIGNDLVNLSATIVAGLIALALTRVLPVS